MPDIGLFELILIGAIAFLILGPERLPDFFAQIGRVVRQGRMWVTSIKQQLDEETREVRASGEEVRDAFDAVSSVPEEPTDDGKPLDDKRKEDA
jgi:sec-independent protein translocase protein TatB